MDMEPPAKLLRSCQHDIDWTRCVICQQIKRNKDKTQIKLRRLCQETTAQNLISYATALDKKQLLLILSDPCILIKGCYHGECLANIKVQYDRKSSDNDIMQDDSFERLCNYVQCQLIEKENIIELTQLMDFYKEHHPGGRSFYIKEKLSKHFGDKLVFEPRAQKNESDLVYSSRLTFDKIIKRSSCIDGGGDNCMVFESDEVCRVVDEVTDHNMPKDEKTEQVNDQEKCRKEIKTIYEAMKILRRQTLNIPQKVSWPPRLEELRKTTSQSMIPVYLHNALVWYGTDNDEISEEKLSVQEPRKVVSLAQNMIYFASNGQLRMPKMIKVAVAIRYVSGSKKLHTALSKLGECISYSQLQEMRDLMLAEKFLLKGTLIPDGLYPGIITDLVFDNNDIQEETVDGKGTSHVTTGIAIQSKPDSCAPAPYVSNLEPLSKSDLDKLTISVEPYTFDKRPEHPPSVYLQGIDVYMGGDMEELKQSNTKNLLWYVTRVETNDTPSWSGFHSLQSESVEPNSIGYLPIVNASPTSYACVKTVLNTAKAMSEQLGQETITITVDEGIYWRALTIIWKHMDIFGNIILRLGVFHLKMNFIGVIGKRFGSAGLRELLVEADIVAEGSVDNILSGKQYNRGMRAIKFAAEIMFRAHWLSFLESCTSENLAFIKQVCKDVGKDASLVDLGKVEELYQDFRSTPTTDNAHFWISFLDAADILLAMERATRDNNFHLHLSSLSKMIPYFFAYDHANYAKYGTTYKCDMEDLKVKHPSAYEHICNGGFSVGRTKTCTDMDKTIEETMNKSSKTKGGIIGFSNRPRSVAKWLHTAPQNSNICTLFFEELEISEDYQHKDCGPTRISKDNQLIDNGNDLLESWGNPFMVDRKEGILHLYTGQVANEQITHDLLTALDRGKMREEEFIMNRLITTNIKFHAPMKRMNLLTFSNMKQDTEVKSNVQTPPSIINDALAMAHVKNVAASKLFEYELSQYPRALAKDNGNLMKTQKSTLGLRLEEAAIGNNQLENERPLASIYDAGFIWHSTIVNDKITYEEFAHIIFSRLTQDPFAQRIYLACDQYSLQVSTPKGLETKLRQKGKTSCRIFIRSDQQHVPVDMASYLADGENKDDFTEFLIKQWSKPKYGAFLQDKELFIDHNGRCVRINCSNGTVSQTEIPQLSNNFDEADFKCLLLAKHAVDEGYHAVIISEDTDVLILSIHHEARFNGQLYVRRGQRMVNVKAISENLGQQTCTILPAFHGFTGTDITSSFYGKGKLTPLKVVLKSEKAREIFEKLGSGLRITKSVMDVVEDFVSALYGRKGKALHTIRYELWEKNPNIPLTKLPPTRDSLKQHLLRAQYYALVSKNALNTFFKLPDPLRYGWHRENGQLAVKWQTRPLSPF